MSSHLVYIPTSSYTLHHLLVYIHMYSKYTHTIQAPSEHLTAPPPVRLMQIKPARYFESRESSINLQPPTPTPSDSTPATRVSGRRRKKSQNQTRTRFSQLKCEQMNAKHAASLPACLACRRTLKRGKCKEEETERKDLELPAMKTERERRKRKIKAPTSASSPSRPSSPPAPAHSPP